MTKAGRDPTRWEGSSSARSTGKYELPPSLKKAITISLLLVGLGLIAGGLALMRAGLGSSSLIAGTAFIALCIGYSANAKWARLTAGIAVLLLGVWIAIAPLAPLITARTDAQAAFRDSFAEMPVPLIVAIAIIGVGIAEGGLALIIVAAISRPRFP